MVDASFAGRSYPPVGPYVVSREKIREFAAAVGADHPAHYDVAAAQALGYGDVVAPASFGVVIAQAAEAQYVRDPAADIDFSRVVHAEERFTHTRPLVAGDEVMTTLRVDSVTERAGLATITTTCFLTDQTGAPIASVTSTLAVRPEES